MNFIKPNRLQKGDKIAAISLSWGGAGDKEILWRYNLGKKRLEEEFGLIVVEMENTLKGSKYIYEHPEKRAEDLMNAFKDKSIKWPKENIWRNSILFLETSEDMPDLNHFERWIRNYGSQGILEKINGIIIGKPYDNKYYDEYKNIILKIVRDELKLNDLPIMYNMNFGHTSPMIIIPYGAIGEIDCDKGEFSILDSGVV